ncbi:MAG: hypothetical protein ABSE68_00055 [Minisyncoccia bacterium]
MQKLTKTLGDIAKISTFLAIAALVSGFLIWNIYLVRLGFYEFNLIQARYIHAGITFLTLVTPIIFLILWIVRLLSKKFLSITKPGLYAVYCYFGIVFFLLLIPLYTFLVFPRISQAWGGAQPRVLGIIASEPDIAYLANFGIKNAYPLITGNLCIAYENQESVIILLEDRVLFLKKDNFKGFNSLPAKTRDEAASECSKRAMGWILNQGEWAK